MNYLFWIMLYVEAGATLGSSFLVKELKDTFCVFTSSLKYFESSNKIDTFNLYF